MIQSDQPILDQNIKNRSGGYKKSPPALTERLFGDLGEDRTLDPLIKSQLLYRLSYQVISLFRAANMWNNFGFRMFDFGYI